jgi:A/G-specific adenine glycosylase
MKNAEFQELVWQRGNELFRSMPWRTDTRAYYVLVSELMLQQTQVARVIPKFNAFVAQFPDEKTLADAPLADILTAWQGLGYNRRAKFLHEAAKKIVYEYGGVWPETDAGLQTLPGVGVNTAGALRAYAFNQPAVFVETNVRTVYFYHFFDGEEAVSDTVLREQVADTIDAEHPREWYWALMDYGTWLKQQGMGQNNKSKHYKKQSPLEGSVRQMRGAIVRELSGGASTLLERFTAALRGLLSDGLIEQRNGGYNLTK